MRQIFTLAIFTFKELLRKKDFYVFLILFFALGVFFYNDSFSGIKDTSRYLKDIGLSLITIFSLIIAITFSAKQIPGELETKTIYPLLAKPVSRNYFVLGKFLGSLYISFLSFTVFYILFLFIIRTKGEFASVALLFQVYIFSLCLLCLISAITLFLSIFLTLSANVTIVLLLYILISWYNGFLRDSLLNAKGKLSIANTLVYYLLPHFEFYDIKIRLVHLWDPLPLWVIAAVTAYTLIYAGIVIAFANLAFKRKSL